MQSQIKIKKIQKPVRKHIADEKKHRRTKIQLVERRPFKPVVVEFEPHVRQKFFLLYENLISIFYLRFDITPPR